VDSLLNGDYGTAVHLAYYSELRAAMSFLASEGIGVFHNHHCWVDSTGNGHIFRASSTHAFVWQAIQKWAEYQPKSRNLLDLFRIEGITISDWLTAAGYVPGSIPAARLAQDWLKDWSLDLALVEKDRTFRNYVSYRPQNMQSQFNPSAFQQNLETIIEYWRVCEPSGLERCSILDRYLLRHALESTYQIRTGQRYLGKRYRIFIEHTLSNLSLSPGLTLNEFLLRKRASTNHLLLKEAKKKGRDRYGKLRPLSVIARAVLLLRLCSAAVDNIMQIQSISCEDIGFWWRAFGHDIGLWDANSEPDSITDLWADIQPVLDDLAGWCNENTSPVSVARSKQQWSFEIWQLTQFQRAGLWAIGL
jgi:hypothetical protein